MSDWTLPSKIKIVEVGPRDGLQNEKSILPLVDKVSFISDLLQAGLKEIEVTSFVRRESIPQMGDATELIAALKDQGLFSPERCMVLVPNLKGLEMAMSTGVQRLAWFTAASETFNKKNINATIDESFENMQAMKQFLTSQKKDIRVRGYLSTVFGCPYEGKVAPEKVLALTRKLFQLGVEEISFGDTVGVATPLQVKNLCRLLKQEFPLNKIAMHFHDTRGMAIANILSSLEEGVTIFDASAGGLGGCPYAVGATGNVATEEVIYLMENLGIGTDVDLPKLIKASTKVLKKLGRSTPSKFLLATLASKS